MSSNLEKAMNICAVMDIQGFSIGKSFYPREVAIVSEDLKVCFEIDSQIPKDLKIKSFRSFSFQKHQIHGIPVENVIKERSSQIINLKDLQNFLLEIYCRIRTEEKTLIAIKNQQLAKILNEYNIPYFDLEKEKIGYEICPPLHRFDSFNFRNDYFCLLHFLLNCNSHHLKTRCSLRKSAYIWSWISNKIQSEIIIRDIIEAIRDCA